MDYDTFLSSQRWVILEIIAKKPSSPVEISQKIGTSVSYVSQQVKLLEAAGLIRKERTGSADKGKPRLVYSIAREILQVTGLLRNSPMKKNLSLDLHKKVTLRIWDLENESLHPLIEKFYWEIEADLKDVSGIYFDSSKKELLLVSDSKKIRANAEKLEGLKTKFVSESELKKFGEVHVLYDPNLLGDKQFLKGGNDK